MNEYPHLSEGILGEDDIPKTNTELFLSMVEQYFPEAIKDGEVDFTALKEEMGEFREVGPEHYDFTWAGKQAAKKEAQGDIFGKSLRFKPDDSVNADTTENIYIEGDNLEALKLLRRNYRGMIKMIYIDPPYNTGTDFVYRDKFTLTDEELAKLSGDLVDGVRYRKNSKDDARYHTVWLNMMYPRLKIAREFLSDDGVILISIDDNEVENMKKIGNEVFGRQNFVAQLVWEKKKKGSFLSNAITNVKEYVLVFCYDYKSFEGLIGEINDNSETYPCINASNKRELRTIPAGIESKYREKNYFLPNGTEISDTTMSIVLHSDLVIKNGILANTLIIEGNWRYSQEAMTEYAKKKELYITRDLYLRRIVNDVRFKTMKDLLPRLGDDTEVSHKDDVDLNNLGNSGWGSNEDADEELRLLFGIQKIMDYPKPTRLLLKLFSSYRNTKESIVLDFFSGSATAAHAVIGLNAKDKGHRKFIMVQFPEPCDEKSEAFKAGYKNICEIGKERIRRAAKKIHEDNPDAEFDDGFKVFEVGGTNIRWNSATDDDIKMLDDKDYSNGDKESLDFTPGHNDIDIVYEVMLRQFGIPLSTPIVKLPEIGERTYMFADAVVVCLEPEIDDALIEKLAAIDPVPMKFVVRDSAFNDDIALKEYSFRKLSALIRGNLSAEEKKSKYNNYTVEFI